MSTATNIGASLGAGLLLGAGALAIAARRAGVSFGAELVSRVVLPMMNMRGAFADASSVRKTAATDRKKGPALPPSSLRRKHRFEDVHEAGRTFVVTPGTVTPTRAILYLHGGAYVTGLAAAHWTVIASLVESLGAKLVIPLYPLAPEHDWQAGFAMVNAAYDQLVDEFGAGNVAIAGDSAGGGFALATAQKIRDEGRASPAALLLLSPWADVTMSDPRQREIEKRDPMLTIAGARAAGLMWAGELLPDDPRISPLFGTLSQLPPIAVFTGTNDVLNTDAQSLAVRSAKEGTTLELFEYPNMFHVWMLMGIPEGQRCLDQANDFLRRHFA